VLPALRGAAATGAPQCGQHSADRAAGAGMTRPMTLTAQ
jgi:hypothetical protein